MKAQGRVETTPGFTRISCYPPGEPPTCPGPYAIPRAVAAVLFDHHCLPLPTGSVGLRSPHRREVGELPAGEASPAWVRSTLLRQRSEPCSSRVIVSNRGGEE